MAQPLPRVSQPPTGGELRDAFLDEAAHQLRTPLSPLLMLAHLIGEHPDLPEALGPHVALLRENVERAARLIDDLADYGRLRAGRLTIEHEQLDFGALVSESVAARRGLAAERKVRIEASLAGDLPPLRGDAPRLRRAVDTLFCNAIVHAEPDTAITVRTRTVGGTVALTVADQGRGLTAAALDQLFDGKALGCSRVASHLGVGLVLGKAIAERHGGTLEAHSDGMGRGAMFMIRIPVASLLDQR